MLRFLLLIAVALPLFADRTVTLLHFSDYHSHALPFYTDAGERGGIARAIGYLSREKRRGALVFSGGDTVNKGAPAWSDKYGCAEWAWWNGIVDAMAFGNHDADYGKAAFDKCRESAKYPILGGNVSGLPATAIVEVNRIKVGVFAIAGEDFPKLVTAEGFKFSHPIQAARDAVRELRAQGANVVVLIGHQSTGDSYALANSVPGIDLILGTHSHTERALTKIAGTATWFIAPDQYLASIGRVDLGFQDGRLTSVAGELVPVDASLPEDAAIAKRVKEMQAALEKDPAYRDLFVQVATLGAPLSVEALTQRTLDVMRAAARTDVALSTKSSFRGALPSGAIPLELLRAVLPYDNEIVVCTMSGPQLETLIEKTRDSVASAGAPPIDLAKSYKVAATDYLAFVEQKDLFKCEPSKTGLRVREELRKSLAKPK